MHVLCSNVLVVVEVTNLFLVGPPQRNEDEEGGELDTTHLGKNGTGNSSVSYGSDKDPGGSLEGSLQLDSY